MNPTSDPTIRRGSNLGATGALLETLLPESIGLLRELVRIPSYRGRESAIQSRIAQLFRARGLQVTEVCIEPTRLARVRGFSPSKENYAGRPNLAAVLPGSGGGRSLAINFHVDTAPPGPEELWETEAFSGELKDGKVYGRGAWDDKAGAVLAFLVLDTIQRADLKLRGDLIFQSVIEDEHTGNGTLALVERGFGADGALVLDGAYGPRAILSHPGYTNFRVTLYGKAAPSCRSEMGENAIEKAFAIIRHLRALESQLANEVPDTWRGVNHPINFNVGTISGGEWTGSVASKCIFDAQMSFLPPFTLDTFRVRLRQEIAAACAEDQWLSLHPPQVEFFDLGTEPVELDEPSEFLELLDHACQTVWEKDLTRAKVTGWCDLRHFSLFKPTPSALR